MIFQRPCFGLKLREILKNLLLMLTAAVYFCCIRKLGHVDGCSEVYF